MQASAKEDSGKITLMRAIANHSLEVFPDQSEVTSVFVAADIMGELSHCLDSTLSCKMRCSRILTVSM